MVTKRTVLFASERRDVVELVKHVSASRGETVSSFVRRAVRKELASLSYLTPAQKKALGVPTSPTEKEH